MAERSVANLMAGLQGKPQLHKVRARVSEGDFPK
jgi:hypothetical protein